MEDCPYANIDDRTLEIRCRYLDNIHVTWVDSSVIHCRPKGCPNTMYYLHCDQQRRKYEPKTCHYMRR